MRVYRQDEHQRWGNKISWWKEPHYGKKRWFRKRLIEGEIVGWLPRKPRAGDLFISPTKDGNDSIFLITSVKCAADPVDMFYADVVFLKLEPGRRTRRNRVTETDTESEAA